jgi:hypothetical protein
VHPDERDWYVLLGCLALILTVIVLMLYVYALLAPIE